MDGFRSIGELAGVVMQRIEMQMDRQGGAVTLNDPAAAATCVGGGAHVRIGTKGTPAETGAKSQGRNNVIRGEALGTARRVENDRANGSQTRPVLRLIDNRDGRAHAPRVSPLGARPSLVLVWSADHASIPVRRVTL